MNLFILIPGYTRANNMKVTAKSSTNVQVLIKSGRHEFIADEPLGVGDDAGPDPYSLLLCLVHWLPVLS
jgi:hypothetical protein